MLDPRKQHVKYWRPQIILLVSNPGFSVQLIDFINDIKKSGLYIIAHVCVGTLDNLTSDPAIEQQPSWLDLTDRLKVKAFTELTLAPSVRDGMNHLVRLSGLGGMKPNTVCLGFYKDGKTTSTSMDPRLADVPLWSAADDAQETLTPTEYVNMIRDVLRLKRNLFICRHFHKLNKSEMLYIKSHVPCIDVWPIDFLHGTEFFDNTCLFMLQLACVLHMVPAWKKRCVLRVFLCTQNSDATTKERKLQSLLRQLRIKAKIIIVQWDHVTRAYGPSTHEGESTMMRYLQAVNRMIAEQSVYTVASFLYLPIPPDNDACVERYLEQLNVLSADLCPTVFVHGLFPVTSTTL